MTPVDAELAESSQGTWIPRNRFQHRRSAFRVRERTIHARELLGSRAAFLTASTIEVMPIESVDGVHLTRSMLEAAEIQALFAASRDAELAVQRRTSAYID